MEKRDEKSNIYKHRRGIRGHMLNFEQVEILATECMDDQRKFIEGVHIKLKRATINKAADVPNCYYQVVKGKQL